MLRILLDSEGTITTHEISEQLGIPNQHGAEASEET